MAFFEFTDGLITRVTDFWPEPYEPPPGREHLVERWLPEPADGGLGRGADGRVRVVEGRLKPGGRLRDADFTRSAGGPHRPGQNDGGRG
jgi:hypothetical protein